MRNALMERIFCRRVIIRRILLIVAIFLAVLQEKALAGPPFVTDDPEPTDTGHWEIYNFVSGAEAPGLIAGQAGFDINYGGAKDLQLTAVVPLDYETKGATGLGDVQLAAKYKFLHQSEGSLAPDLAIFPRFFTPTAGRALGNGRFSLFVPIWGEKDFGKWSVFGGGGYDINPGPGERNYWQSGLTLTRTLSESFTVGVEVYRQNRSSDTAPTYLGANIGALYKLTPHWSLIGAAGPGLEHARQEGRANAYIALEAQY
jgi:hypothetical protein